MIEMKIRKSLNQPYLTHASHFFHHHGCENDRLKTIFNHSSKEFSLRYLQDDGMVVERFIGDVEGRIGILVFLTRLNF